MLVNPHVPTPDPVELAPWGAWGARPPNKLNSNPTRALRE